HRGRVRFRRFGGQHRARAGRELPRQGADRNRRFQSGLWNEIRRHRFRHRRRARGKPLRAPAQARRGGHHRRPARPGASRRQPQAARPSGAPAARQGLKAFLQSPLAAIAAALVAGALTVAAFAPLAVFPLPFLTLAGLLLIWLRAAAQAAFWAGFAFGAGLFGVGASWVYVSLHDFGLMPAPLAAIGTLAYCAILALYPAAVGWCLARLRPGLFVSALLAFPALWTFFEWLRGWVFTGVPWLALGYSQVDSPLAGFAPVLGIYGVSWVTALCAGLLVVVLTSSGKARLAVGVALVLALG